MEEIFKNPLFNLVFAGLIFFLQLYHRTIMATIMRDMDRSEKRIKELYQRTDEITAIKTDLKNLRDECARLYKK